MAKNNQELYNKLSAKYNFEKNETVEMEIKSSVFSCFIKNLPQIGIVSKSGVIYLTSKRLIFVKGKNVDNSGNFCFAYKDLESFNKCFVGIVPYGVRISIKNDNKNIILYLLNRSKILNFVEKHLN